jgi:cytochrome c553
MGAGRIWLSLLVLLATANLAHADDAAEMQRAEELVGGRCFLCHGAAGESSSPLYPKIAGQHPEYILKQLKNFKSGERESNDMRKVVPDLSEADMKALATFFSRQSVSPGKSAFPEMRALGEKLYTQGNAATGVPPCRKCHGDKGAGSASLPRIAGQHTLYIETQLALFEERRRTNDNAQMQEIANKMSPDEIRAVAEYLSGL